MSINNALLALCKDIDMVRRDPDELAHVEALLAMCGIDLPNVMVRFAPVATRRHMRRIVLEALRVGPTTRRSLWGIISATTTIWSARAALLAG